MNKINITTEDIQNIVYNATVRLLKEEKEGQINEAHGPKGDTPYKFRKRHFSVKDKKKTADGIIDWLKKDTTDCAAIAAQLWPNKDEDSRRSYFYKCRDHAGYTAHGKTRHYDFTKKQYLRLFGIMTNSVS